MTPVSASIAGLRIGRVWLFVVASALSACGGGSGGGNESAPAAPLRVSPAAITRTVAINDPQPTIALTATLANAYANGILSIRRSAGAVASVAGEFTSATTVAVTVILKAPNESMPTVFHDQLLLRLCVDSSCSQVVAGSDVTVPVTYTITAPAPGHEPSLSFAPLAVVGHIIEEFPEPQPSVSNGALVPLPITVRNVAMPVPTTFSSYTTNGITAVYGPLYMDTQSNGLQVTFKNATTAGLGVHHDTIALSACLDTACVNPLPGSPYTIPVDYTVTNTYSVAGANGYTWNPAYATTERLAWNPVSQRLVALSSYLTPAASLLSIDPVTRAVDWTYGLGAYAMAIAISNDGLYAYVATHRPPLTSIGKIRLSDRAIMSSVALGDNQTVDELKTAPGLVDIVAVTTHVNYTDNQVRLLNMSGSGAITDAFNPGPGSTVMGLAWNGAASMLYAYDSYGKVLYSFHRNGALLGSPDILPADLSGAQRVGSRIEYAPGLLIESHGGVFDLTAQRVTSIIALPMGFGSALNNPDYSSVAVDATNHRLYFRYTAGGSATISAFDLSNLSMIGTISVNSWGWDPLVRWGRDGLAYATGGGYVGIMTGPFVVP